MAKYRFEDLGSQADLDRLLREVRSTSSDNYSEAAERTQRKLEKLQADNRSLVQELNQLEANHKETIEELTSHMKDYETKLEEAYAANDTYELADMLNEAGIPEKYHEFAIFQGGLTSDMEAEEFTESINGLLETHPEFGLRSGSHLAEQFEETPEAEYASEEEQTSTLDFNKVYQ